MQFLVDANLPPALAATKDEDFARMVAVRKASPTVVWLRVGNTRRSELLEQFAKLIGRIEMLATEHPGQLIEVQ